MYKLQFCSAELETHQQSVAIEDTFSNHLKMDIDLPDDLPSALSMTAYAASNLSVMSLSGTPARAVRTSAQASVSADDVILCLTQNSDVCIQKPKSEKQVFRSGEAHIWKADEIFSCDVMANYSTVMFSIPASALKMVDIDLDRALHQGLSNQSAEMNLLTGYTRTWLREADSLSQNTIERSTTHIQDLALAAICSDQERRHFSVEKSLRAARLISIKEQIEKNLLRPDLSAGWIAGREGISQRYLRDLFAIEQTNFTDYVMARRLTYAHQKLTSHQFIHQSISTIAYESGFGDLSYFGRVFKRHFGATPSDIRNAAQE